MVVSGAAWMLFRTADAAAAANVARIMVVCDSHSERYGGILEGFKKFPTMPYPHLAMDHKGFSTVCARLVGCVSTNRTS